MKFPPSILEEIKARLPVSAVVGKRVRLAKSGREWKGLSPFNAEKTPSFFVNDQKGSFFDFSSGKNGDIFKFVMETEGLSFPEAVEKLASEAGVTLPKITVEAQAQEERRRGLHEVVELAARFFEAELVGGAWGCGAALSLWARAGRRSAQSLPHRLWSARQVRAARPSRRQGRRCRADDGDGPPGAWRRDRCAL